MLTGAVQTEIVHLFTIKKRRLRYGILHFLTGNTELKPGMSQSTTLQLISPDKANYGPPISALYYCRACMCVRGGRLIFLIFSPPNAQDPLTDRT